MRWGPPTASTRPARPRGNLPVARRLLRGDGSCSPSRSRGAHRPAEAHARLASGVVVQHHVDVDERRPLELLDHRRERRLRATPSALGRPRSNRSNVSLPPTSSSGSAASAGDRDTGGSHTDPYPPRSSRSSAAPCRPSDLEPLSIGGDSCQQQGGQRVIMAGGRRTGERAACASAWFRLRRVAIGVRVRRWGPGTARSADHRAPQYHAIGPPGSKPPIHGKIHASTRPQAHETPGRETGYFVRPADAAACPGSLPRAPRARLAHRQHRLQRGPVVGHARVQQAGQRVRRRRHRVIGFGLRSASVLVAAPSGAILPPVVEDPQASRGR